MQYGTTIRVDEHRRVEILTPEGRQPAKTDELLDVPSEPGEYEYVFSLFAGGIAWVQKTCSACGHAHGSSSPCPACKPG